MVDLRQGHSLINLTASPAMSWGMSSFPTSTTAVFGKSMPRVSSVHSQEARLGALQEMVVRRRPHNWSRLTASLWMRQETFLSQTAATSGFARYRRQESLPRSLEMELQASAAMEDRRRALNSTLLTRWHS